MTMEKKAITMSFDPHVWLSPVRAIKLVGHIRDSLSADYPDKKRLLRRMRLPILKKLQALDKAYTDGLSQAKQKSFVTQHAAFRYLALDYGLKQVSISGLSPDAEPSAARLAELNRVYQEKQDFLYHTLKKMPHKPSPIHFQKKQVSN